jgi:hypothetical protein
MTINWYDSQIEKTKRSIKALEERLLYYEAQKGQYLDKQRKYQREYKRNKRIEVSQ